MIDIDKLRLLLTKHEDKRYRLYSDKTGVEYRSPKGSGKLTIGIGYNIEDLGLPDEIIQLLFKITLQEAVETCQLFFPAWRDINSDRSIALASVAFNLGRTKFSGFKNMIAAVNRQDWQAAAAELMDSDAARELPKRYKELHDMLKGGHDV